MRVPWCQPFSSFLFFVFLLHWKRNLFSFFHYFEQQNYNFQFPFFIFCFRMALKNGILTSIFVSRFRRVLLCYLKTVAYQASSETQGQLVGTGKSLKRAKKSQERKEELFFAFLTFLRPNFSSPVLDFSPSPLTAPGSPRMPIKQTLALFRVVSIFSPRLLSFKWTS